MRNPDTDTPNTPITPPRAEEKAPAKQTDQGRTVLIILALLVYITLAEYLSTTLATVLVGLVMHGMALVVLLLLSALLEDPKEQRIYLTLAFAPLIRLVSLSLPLQGWPMMYWYLLVGIPITISIVMVVRYGRFTNKDMGLTANSWFLQILFGLSGIGLGYIEYLILRPEPLADELTLRAIWIPALILIIFTGFLEEIIFRGLMQTAFAARMHRWVGILLISILFAILHLGYHSLLDVIFVFLVAMLFAAVTDLTGSIWGVSIAHGLTNVTLFLVFPFMIGQGMQPFSPQQISQFFTGQPTPTVQVLEAAPTLSPLDMTLTLQALSPTVTLTPTLTEIPFPTETPSITPTILPIIVDCGDPGFFRQGGEHWQAEQGYQGGLVWAYTRYDEPDVRITWGPDLAVCGRYRIEVYIPADFGLAPSITYQVNHRDGMDQVEIDQSEYQGEWVSLGAYWCEAGTACRVEATNLTGIEFPITFAAFDALRLTFIEGCL